MANYRFFKISEANAEIDRLTSELQATKKSLEDAKASLDEVADKFSAAAVEQEKKLEEATAKAGGDSERVAKLETELSEAKKQLTDANAKLEGFDKRVEESASAKALQITAAQGQAPLPDVPADAPKTEASASLTGLAKVEAIFAKQIARK